MSESADAVEAVMEGVTEVLSDSGHDAPANLDRARNTLRALATDEELRAEFEAGRVVTDHEPVGFGAAAGKIKPAPRKRQREDQAERRRRKQAAARVERAKTALERADRAVDDTRGKLRVAEDERVKRAEELEKAEAELGT